jgi:predicted MFS family arabinose efflux permease
LGSNAGAVSGDAAEGHGLGAVWRRRQFALVAIGFFACGVQLVFIGTHLAAFLVGCGLTARNGAVALALIGLFNVAGTFILGRLAVRFPPGNVLAWVYAVRTTLIVWFILSPVTPTSASLFAAGMGLLWLGVGPVMTQLLAMRFGVRHVSALFGGMYLVHQIGSFLGAWLGGRIFEATGSYSGAWWFCIAAGIAAVFTTLASGTDTRLKEPLFGRTGSAPA